jgi:protein-tyrosine phosphatase
VGEWVALTVGRSYLPPGRLLHGGKLGTVRDPAEIGQPRTIINLRMGEDRETFGAAYHHVSIPNEHEKYDTRDRAVQRWLNAVAASIAEAPGTPILVHCASGKDRTGMVMALLLRILGVPREVIVEEYLLSDGGDERAWIMRALDGVANVEVYLDRVDLKQVRATLAGGQRSSRRLGVGWRHGADARPVPVRGGDVRARSTHRVSRALPLRVVPAGARRRVRLLGHGGGEAAPRHRRGRAARGLHVLAGRVPLVLRHLRQPSVHAL